MTKENTSKTDTYSRDQVVSIINSVIGKVSSTQEIPREVICNELTSLKNAIVDLRYQLHAVQPSDISQTDIPNAKDELDAVVDATEKATHTIMDSCEKILAGVASANSEITKKTEAEIVRIYEACTFQDITGQRIKKVVKTLKKIDENVSSILVVLDGQLSSPDFKHDAKKTDLANATTLMNGPALPQNAMSQEEIDKLLASFD